MVKAQEIIVKCLVEMIKNVYLNADKEELTLEYIQEKLEQGMSLESVPSKKPKAKKPRVQKEIPQEHRCSALKKDGGRCNGRKHDKGENPEICSLHNNKGAKFGFVVVAPVTEVEEVEEEVEEFEEVEEEPLEDGSDLFGEEEDDEEENDY